MKSKTLRVIAAVCAAVLLGGCDASSAPTARASVPNHTTLCSPEAAAWQDGTLSLSEAIKGGNPYRGWTVFYDAYGVDGQLRLWESEKDEAVCYELDGTCSTQTVDNLKTGTTYHYTVEIGTYAESGSLSVKEGTRFVHIPGAQNTRDIGGVKTTDGRTVRQGMLIRGTELDGLGDERFRLASDAVKTVQDTFGFVCDFDLRAAQIEGYVSPLGSLVKHTFYAAPMYEQVFEDEGKAALKAMFSDLANQENYPMYLHCTYGADRTGTLIFLLQGLLGVSEEAAVREYRTTAFAFEDYVDNDDLERLIAGLEPFEGTTIGEKIETFLTEAVGVTPEECEAIRAVLLK